MSDQQMQKTASFCHNHKTENEALTDGAALKSHIVHDFKKSSVAQSTITNALPAITANLNSLADVGWYRSVFQSPCYKAYKYLDLTWVFLATILPFELGCLIVELAPTATP
ncbi:hypothetical protein GGR56DRAFT_674246 [Xylariaceae sp. FL0804]|nr:hypothetical protein GGR56DRAFT_674246 [Xylariaceae sp. FL0804]